MKLQKDYKTIKRDEMRHVAYGIEHVKSAIEQNPNRINALKNTAFKKKRVYG